MWKLLEVAGLRCRVRNARADGFDVLRTAVQRKGPVNLGVQILEKDMKRSAVQKMISRISVVGENMKVLSKLRCTLRHVYAARGGPSSFAFLC